jgi:hypothetical protein
MPASAVTRKEVGGQATGGDRGAHAVREHGSDGRAPAQLPNSSLEEQ